MRTIIAPTIRDDVQPQAKALGDPTRFRIFRYVFEAGSPVGVSELTTYTQLNHNAVRQHLDVLTSAGLVIKEIEDRRRPGRPRLMYTPAPDVAGLWGTPGAYEYLATLLSEMLRTGAAPEDVGRSVGRQRAVELSRRPHGSPLTMIEAEMARIGFRPTIRQRSRSVDLVLGQCPFESAAAANPGVVCGIHRGLAEGLAEEIGGIDVEDLVAKNPHRAGCRLVMHVSDE